MEDTTVPAVLVNSVREIVVHDYESRAEAESIICEARARKAQVVAYFKELKDQANRTHKDICAKEKAALAPWDMLEKEVVAKRLAFDTAQAEIARAAQQAEMQRLREQEVAARAEADRIRQEAETARAFGDEDGAKAIEITANAAEVSAFVARKTAQAIKPGKPEGTREKRCYRVTDKNLIPREFLIPDDETLTFRARKKYNEPIPGIEFYVEYVPVVRGAA